MRELGTFIVSVRVADTNYRDFCQSYAVSMANDGDSQTSPVPARTGNHLAMKSNANRANALESVRLVATSDSRL